MRVLVTGAAGFIGSTVVDQLLAGGHEVVAVDDLSTGNADNLADALNGHPSECTFVRTDICDAALIDVVADAAPEVVCHLAAKVSVRLSVADPLGDAHTNITGTLNVLEAARRSGARKVVFASSGGSIYGSPDRLPVTEQQPVDPHSPYAAGKAAAELYLGAFHAMYGLAYTSLALGNVYGPRQDPMGEAGVVAIFCGEMMRGDVTFVYGDGLQTRDYVYVDDVADAFVRAVSAGDGERFNIGTGVETSDLELHALLARAFGKDERPAFEPARLGDLRAIALDPSAAGASLGWRPLVALAEGIPRTADWFRARLK